MRTSSDQTDRTSARRTGGFEPERLVCVRYELTALPQDLFQSSGDVQDGELVCFQKRSSGRDAQSVDQLTDLRNDSTAPVQAVHLQP